MRLPDESFPGADGHRWHSPDYVAAWISAREQHATPEYRDRHRERLAAVERSIPQPREAPITILDLGAGWGRLIRHLLDAFPNARAVACDGSRPMLREARRALSAYAGRVQFVECDLEQPGAFADLGTAFDAVVSTETLHHVGTRRLAALYREVSAVLRPGGAFVGLDRVRRRRDSLLSAIARCLPSASTGGAAVHGATRAQHLRMLRGAGFAVCWRAVGTRVLIVATRRPTAS